MPITLAVRGQTAEYTANSPRLIQADEVPLRVTLPRSPLLSKVNCAWTDEPESQYKTEAQEVLDWFRHRIRDSYFDDFNSHCTLIAEALTTRGLPLKIDGPAAVRAVCDHLLDPELADEIESDAQLPKKVMESLLNLTTMQGWNDQLVEQFKSLPCIRLMTQRIKRMKQMANLK